MADNTRAEWPALLAHLQHLGAMTIACSGGVDSRFLAHAALQAGVDARLVHIAGPHVPAKDTQFMLSWAESLDLEVTVLALNPLNDIRVRAADKDRCYFCKRFLFEEMRRIAPGLLCDGSNASDANSFRPGAKALRELGVVSPLADVGLTKDSVYFWAQKTGLARPRQLSGSCLLTRFAYGLEPSVDWLAKVDGAEQALGSILHAYGLDVGLRLRILSGSRTELHLELDDVNALLRADLTDCLARTGFSQAEIRCVARVSGYFDETTDSGAGVSSTKIP